MNGCLQLSVSPSAFHFNSKFNGLFLDNLGLTCSHIKKKTVIGRVTYEVGVHAILGSFCAGISSHIKTVIGRVTYEIAVHAILGSLLSRPLFTYKNGDW